MKMVRTNAPISSAKHTAIMTMESLDNMAGQSVTEWFYPFPNGFGRSVASGKAPNSFPDASAITKVFAMCC